MFSLRRFQLPTALTVKSVSEAAGFAAGWPQSLSQRRRRHSLPPTPFSRVGVIATQEGPPKPLNLPEGHALAGWS